MKYFLAYFKALWAGFKILGAVYLALAAFEAEKALPIFLAYVCFWMAFGGPMGTWIEKIEKENPIV